MLMSFLASHREVPDPSDRWYSALFGLISEDDPCFWCVEDHFLGRSFNRAYAAWHSLSPPCAWRAMRYSRRAALAVPFSSKARPSAQLAFQSWEFYPECVEGAVRYAAKETGVPIIVTENGIATTDDTRRVEYYRRALAGLKRAIDDGVDVRGYMTWSLLDNFEWMSGFEPKFGIVAVDLATQRRTIKPSGTYLGNIARRNSL